LAEKVPEEHRDRIERGKKFLTEEYFPEERRDQFIYRGKKVSSSSPSPSPPFPSGVRCGDRQCIQVIIECQSHEDYKESITWLLSYTEHLAEHGRRKTMEHAEGAKAKVEVRRPCLSSQKVI